eukprot:9490210-Pyramimonas_sp.AAC.1
MIRYGVSVMAWHIHYCDMAWHRTVHTGGLIAANRARAAGIFCLNILMEAARGRTADTTTHKARLQM